MPSFKARFMAGFEAKAAVDPPVGTFLPPSLMGALLSPVQITPHLSWLWYLNVSTFAKVVDMIADAVSDLVPLVQVDGQPLDGHPVMALINRPGFNRNRKRFIKELTVQYLVTGTGFVHTIGNTAGAPLAMDILKTRFVSHYQDWDMWPKQFWYSEGTRSIRFMRDQNPRDFRWIDDTTMMQMPDGTPGALGELLPIYDMDGDYRGIGLPRLNAIKLDVELRLKGIQHNASVLDKGARLSGVLSYKEQLSDDQQSAIQAQFQAMATGVNNAGRVLVTGGGEADFTSLSQTMKDMDFAKLIAIVEDAIVARYNVPVTLFRTDAQTNNNYETAWNILYDQAVLPTFRVVYASLASMFSRRLGYEIEIVHDSLTSPILARQAVARARELFGAFLVSRNEARQIVGYEPVLGGDQILGPMGMVPQGEDYFTGIDKDTEDAPARDKPRQIEQSTDDTDSKKSVSVLRSFARLLTYGQSALH